MMCGPFMLKVSAVADWGLGGNVLRLGLGAGEWKLQW